MTPEQFSAVLAQTLQDHRLTGSERKALSQTVTELHVSDQQLAHFRRLAFEQAAAALADPEARQVLEWLEDVVKVLMPTAQRNPSTTVEAFFSPGDDCCQRL